MSFTFTMPPRDAPPRDRCEVGPSGDIRVLAACRRALSAAAHYPDARVVFAEIRDEPGVIRCLHCHADVTALATPDEWAAALAPAVPAVPLAPL